MKKIFSLELEGKDRARVLERVRSEVGKYINREKRKALPMGHDQWEFACRIGPDEATATPTSVRQVHEAIGVIAATGAPEVFGEILASARPETAKTPKASPSVFRSGRGPTA
jgi:hypothetical protein